MKKFFLFFIFIPSLLFGSAVVFGSAEKAAPINIATGSVGATYYQMASDVAQIAKKKGLKVKVLATAGSIENLALLSPLNHGQKQAAFGFVQEDLYHSAALATSELKKETRAAAKLPYMPLFYEEVHLLVSENIKDLRGLQGKAVSIGAKGSGTAYTAAKLIELYQISPKVKYNMPYEKALLRLKTGQIAGVFFVGGVPLKILSNLKKKSGFKLLSFPNATPPYEQTTIKAGSYPWLKRDVQSLRLRSLVLFDLSKDCKNRLQILQLVAGNLEQLQKTGHPKWKSLQAEQFKGLSNLGCKP